MTLPKDLSWPAAATLITAMIGAAATTVAMTLSSASVSLPTNDHYATAREMGEVKTRLEALEKSTHRVRMDIRSDVRDLQTMSKKSLIGTNHK